MLRTPPQCLSLQNVNLLFYSNGNHVGNILTYYIHSNTLWNSILPLCQSSFYTAGMWGDVVKHNVLPKAQTLCECTHRLQGFFFILYLYLFFLRGQFKKSWKHKSIVRFMFWSSCMCLFLHLQTGRGSDFCRQFVSGNWSFQRQLSVSWELLGEKRACSSFSKCWWIQHNERVTDHKDRQMRFFFSLG